jgi:shikimate dehydrogenase
MTPVNDLSLAQTSSRIPPLYHNFIISFKNGILFYFLINSIIIIKGTEMLENLSGATRLHYIVGDPIAQVKSPFGMTEAFASKGKNAICIPAHVSTSELSKWFEGVSSTQNADGVIVTVPHKFDCYSLCATTSPRAEFLGAVNTIRRNSDGTWHGDMLDGLGYVKAIELKGFSLSGKKALLIGAGGAGSAIAHALIMAGVSHLAIYDENSVRRESLINRLNGLKLGQVASGSSNPNGFDLALNATPAGMKTSDPLPIDVTKLNTNMFVGCVITQPVITPLIQAAKDLGCNTSTGADMFSQVKELMLDFLLEI